MEADPALVRDCPYIPHDPTPRQWALLLSPEREVLFGGAAGGGKSEALLMASLMWTHLPGHHALLLRRTYQDLALPGGLMDLAHQWLMGTDATRHEAGKVWRFPSGSSLTFGYLQTDVDKYRYQGSSFTFIGWDELTQFPKPAFTYLFSRLRRPEGSTAPLMVRAASNPGGIGHDWVKSRYVTSSDPARVFLPSKLADNPHIDAVSYREALSALDPVTRRQLEHGDWDVSPSGGFIPTEKLQRYPVDPPGRPVERLRVRAWDLAATTTGDYSAGVLVSLDPHARTYRIEDVVRVRQAPADLERTMQSAAARDGIGTPIVIEQEPGSSGLIAMRDIRTRVLAGYPVYPVRPTGPKIERARLLASLVDNGDVAVNEGDWTEPFIDELRAFPEGRHDDMVDAASHATHYLTRAIGGRRPAAPTGSRERVPTGAAPATKVRIQR